MIKIAMKIIASSATGCGPQLNITSYRHGKLPFGVYITRFSFTD